MANARLAQLVSKRKESEKEMALGLVSESGGGGGDIIPIIKFDAKAGDMIRVDRTQDASGEWQKEQTDLSLPMAVVMDLAEIETGWMGFPGGQPDFHMVKVGEQMPAKPSDDHKQAFRVRVFGTDMGLREFSSQAKTVIREMDSLHNQFEAERADNAGKLPVVTIQGTKPITINTPQGEQRFKVPDWKITSWVERPAGMDGVAPTPVAAPSAPTSAPADTGTDLF